MMHEAESRLLKRDFIKQLMPCIGHDTRHFHTLGLGQAHPNKTEVTNWHYGRISLLVNRLLRKSPLLHKGGFAAAKIRKYSDKF